MSEKAPAKKVYFVARLMRGMVCGLVMGSILYIVVDILGKAVNTIAARNVIPVDGYSLLALGLGLFAAVGIELCKELTE